MNLYIYEGPVMRFDKCISENWKASTMAKSEKHARSNMAYQFKKTHDMTADALISLPGKIEMIR